MIYMYNKSEVLEYVRSEDVKFIKLAFCDVFGVQKNISILASELERAFEKGISFDASSIDGFTDVVKSDLFLVPDPSTLEVLPWRPSHGKVVRMLCSIMKPDGTPFESDSRYILKEAVKYAESFGVSASFGAEVEFYLFNTDEDGKPTKIPFDDATYLDIAPFDKGENIRREICLTLEDMEIYPEISHHEAGPGQNEIDFRYSDPLSSADNTVTFKSVVAVVAAKNGVAASFDPMPLENEVGNSMHINISLSDASKIPSFIAGVLENIRGITAFLNPTVESYSRLGKGKAPKYVTWSRENRSQLIRIPADTDNRKRFELRSPDPLANPYIAYALLLYAGTEGVKKKLLLCEPCDLNLYLAPESVMSRIESLPMSLEEAVAEAEKNEIVKKYLPQAYCDALKGRLK